MQTSERLVVALERLMKASCERETVKTGANLRRLTAAHEEARAAIADHRSGQNQSSVRKP